MLDLPEVIGFDWDEGNLTKSKHKHRVEPAESEQVFNNNPVYFYDEKHSQQEERYFAYGITNAGVGCLLRLLCGIIRSELSLLEIKIKKSAAFMKKLKKIPRFKNEAEERAFWETHDSTEYIDTTHPITLRFPNLRTTISEVTLKLPALLVKDLKILAQEKEISYEKLLEGFLWEKLREETNGRRSPIHA